jgi:hypothetical protein
MANSATDISLLQETAIRYDKDLKLLPLMKLREELGRLGVTLYPNVQNKDVATHFERKGGILRPYSTSQDIANQDVGKALESILEVKTAYASVKDNIKNYQTIAVGPDNLLGKNISKKHPWNVTMLWAIVATFGEDLLDSLFPGERNDAGTTPLAAFDGFDTKIDTLITSGSIAAAKGNYVSTDTITDPSDSSDTDAYDQLLEFWKSAHPSLRRANSRLLVPWDVYMAYNAAFFNKFKYNPQVDEYQRTYLHGTGKKCLIVPSDAMGTGDRVILTIAGNLHFGMNSLSDDQFVQVRDPYEDPNLKQFWIQGDYGTRILTVNEKVFQVNNGTPVANSLSGDYDSGSAS